MIPVEDKYEFELSEEVRDKIAHADNRHALIDEAGLEDLQYVHVTKKGYCVFKRIMDIAISLAALVVLLLPMLVVAAVVYIDDPGEILFRQYRVGRNGKRFKLYKFRTMKKDTPKYLSTAEVKNPKAYITRVGHFLRRSSLDELPQLINVLKGDMSLVGPRPLISDEYEIHQMRMRFGVYTIRPGVTGLAQINGRDLVTPADKVRYDVKYLERFSLLTDITILFSTVPKIFGGVGVVEGCHPKVEKEKTK